MNKNYKLIRITTVPISLKHLLSGQMSYMRKNGFNVIMVSSYGKELEDVIRNEKCKHIVINLTRKITILKDLYATYKLYMLLRKEKPHIVHTHTPKAGIVGMLASILAGIPIRLHTVAGLPLVEAKGFKRLILNLTEKLTYRFSTMVYSNSFALKDFILKNKFTYKNKLKVIGNGSSNGIDTSYFNPKIFSEDDNEILKNSLGIKKNDFVYIFVGRIVSAKGINELIKAFNKLSKFNDNIKLLLVGAMEDDLDPLDLATKKIINLNPKIILVGYQNDVRPYFSISNCLVFPSYREGFPNVVMQSGAMGLPSIVSNINGCNEIIEDNVNGIIIPAKDTDAVYNSMKKIYCDKNLYNDTKSKSRNAIKKKYERKIFWKQLLNEYNDLLKKNNL